MAEKKWNNWIFTNTSITVCTSHLSGGRRNTTVKHYLCYCCQSLTHNNETAPASVLSQSAKTPPIESAVTEINANCQL